MGIQGPPPVNHTNGAVSTAPSSDEPQIQSGSRSKSKPACVHPMDIENKKGWTSQLEAGIERDQAAGIDLNFRYLKIPNFFYKIYNDLGEGTSISLSLILRGFKLRLPLKENPVLFEKDGLKVTQGPEWQYAPLYILVQDLPQETKEHPGFQAGYLLALEPLEFRRSEKTLFHGEDQLTNVATSIVFANTRARIEFKYWPLSVGAEGGGFLHTPIEFLDKSKSTLAKMYENLLKDDADPALSLRFNTTKIPLLNLWTQPYVKLDTSRIALPFLGKSSAVHSRIGYGLRYGWDMSRPSGEGKIPLAAEMSKIPEISSFYYFSHVLFASGELSLTDHLQIRFKGSWFFGQGMNRENGRDLSAAIRFGSRHHVFGLSGNISSSNRNLPDFGLSRSSNISVGAMYHYSSD